ncbi:hypothetical protein [Streptomyces sp. NPDC052114]|uniref:hypothetical protein n=1 Tax=unclassified Streptomyces TaxID=2593676 RepID=UPI00343E2B64
MNSPDITEAVFRSSRIFRMWRYGVGHSQLLLRATPDADDETCLDLHFEGVAAVQIGTRYVAPEVRLGNDRERAALMDLAAESGASDRHIAIALHSTAGTGLVLCRKVSALRSGPDALGGIEGSEVLWSRRA